MPMHRPSRRERTYGDALSFNGLAYPSRSLLLLALIMPISAAHALAAIISTPRRGLCSSLTPGPSSHTSPARSRSSWAGRTPHGRRRPSTCPCRSSAQTNPGSTRRCRADPHLHGHTLLHRSLPEPWRCTPLVRMGRRDCQGRRALLPPQFHDRSDTVVS